MELENMFEGLFTDDESVATESAEELDFLGLEDSSDIELDLATESQIFLDSLMGTFDDMNEFVDYVTESAGFWEAYGLIDNATAAVEAVKRITVNNWKKVNFDRLVDRECIRIEYKRTPTSSLWKKYAAARKKFIECKEAIKKKNHNQAVKNVRASMNNSVQKAANMQTSGGRDVEGRLKRSMTVSASGHNPNTQSNPSNARKIA